MADKYYGSVFKDFLVRKLKYELNNVNKTLVKGQVGNIVTHDL